MVNIFNATQGLKPRFIMWLMFDACRRACGCSTTTGSHIVGVKALSVALLGSWGHDSVKARIVTVSWTLSSFCSRYSLLEDHPRSTSHGLWTMEGLPSSRNLIALLNYLFVNLFWIFFSVYASSVFESYWHGNFVILQKLCLVHSLILKDTLVKHSICNLKTRN